MEMTLKLPQNYVEIEEEEMMYLDGGWSWSTLGRNLNNLRIRYSSVSRALVGSGISVGSIYKMMRGIAPLAYSKIAAILGSITAANWVVGAAVFVLGASAVWVMGTYNVF